MTEQEITQCAQQLATTANAVEAMHGIAKQCSAQDIERIVEQALKIQNESNIDKPHD